ncbi:MAG: BolA/IbaG family iron-sulfur metabolism protein [Solirubrobacterales bacterium]|nr:BolA/IbaG family iron-sulfur metabolism protein [Solirubrobacterales bacterium]
MSVKHRQANTSFSEAGRYAVVVAVTPEELKQRIEAGIPGSAAQVSGDGQHFRAEVTSPAFAGLSRIAQHKLVYEVFGAEIGDRIHALSIKTEAP